MPCQAEREVQRLLDINASLDKELERLRLRRPTPGPSGPSPAEKAELESLRKRVESLQRQVPSPILGPCRFPAHARAQVKLAEEENAELERANKKLKEALRSGSPDKQKQELERERDRLRQELEALRRQVLSPREKERLQQAERERDRLRDELYALQSSAVSPRLLEREKERAAQLARERDRLQEELRGLRRTTSAASSTSPRAQPQEKRPGAGSPAERYKERAAQLERERDHLREELQEMRREKEWSAKLSQQAIEQEKERAEQLARERDRLQEELEEARRARAGVASARALEQEREKRAQLERERDCLKKELDALRAQGGGSSSSSEKRLEKENRELREELDALRRRYELAVRQLDAARTLVEREHPGRGGLTSVALEGAARAQLSHVVTSLLFSLPIEFDEVADTRQLLAEEGGRRAFVQVLKKTMQKVQTLVLSDQAFEFLLYLLNTALQAGQLASEQDLIAAKILLHSSMAICRRVPARGADQVQAQEQFEYAAEFIREYDIWKNVALWEETFWEELTDAFHEQQELGIVGASEKDLQAFNQHAVPPLLLRFAHTMLFRWAVPFDRVAQFADSIAARNELDEADRLAISRELELFREGLASPQKRLVAEAKMEEREKREEERVKQLSRRGSHQRRPSQRNVVEAVTASARSSSGGGPPHEHQFRAHSFNTPHFCQACGKFIWKAGLQCALCAFHIHRKCLPSPPK